MAKVSTAYTEMIKLFGTKDPSVYVGAIRFEWEKNPGPAGIDIARKLTQLAIRAHGKAVIVYVEVIFMWLVFG